MIFGISFFSLLLALIDAKLVEQTPKTCKILGFNGALNNGQFSISFLNAEEREPIKLNELHTQHLEGACPYLKNTDRVCCDGEQLQDMYITVRSGFEWSTEGEICPLNLLNIYCELFCRPNQNQYVNVIKKTRSRMKYYDDKKDAESISAKLDLDYVNEFFNRCKNFKMTNGQTLEDYIGAHESDEFMFKTFNSQLSVEIDFRFHNKTTNKTHHIVKYDESGKLYSYPIVDNSIEILPIEFQNTLPPEN